MAASLPPCLPHPLPPLPPLPVPAQIIVTIPHTSQEVLDVFGLGISNRDVLHVREGVVVVVQSWSHSSHVRYTSETDNDTKQCRCAQPAALSGKTQTQTPMWNALLLTLSAHATAMTLVPTNTNTHPLAAPQQVELGQPGRTDAAGTCSRCINVLARQNGLV